MAAWRTAPQATTQVEVVPSFPQEISGLAVTQDALARGIEILRAEKDERLHSAV